MKAVPESHGPDLGRLASVRAHLRTTTLLAVRGAALFLAVFTAIGIVGELRGRTLDLSLWLVDLRDIPAIVRILLLAGLAGLLAAWAIRTASGQRLRWATAIICTLFATFALRDVIRFYSAVAAGGVRPVIAVPLSLLIALLLVAIALGTVRLHNERPVGGKRKTIALGSAVAGWAIVFPLAQMLFFGATDYRRPADLAVVFGAGLSPTGQPSPLLADRIRTGVKLYQDGLVPLLVMSGGYESNGYNEAQVMRDVAVADGVDPAAILVDPGGNSTAITVTNVAALVAVRRTAPGAIRVMVVSQAFHLPRVQLAFDRAGIDVLTVPAVDPVPVSGTPTLIAREVPAFWAYFLRICLG